MAIYSTVVTNDLLVSGRDRHQHVIADVAMARQWHHMYGQRNNRSRGTCRVMSLQCNEFYRASWRRSGTHGEFSSVPSASPADPACDM